MIHLKPVDSHNLWALMRLRVAPEQEDFVARNIESIAEAYVTDHDGKVALPFGIYADEIPVGFVMFVYGELDEDDPAIAAGNYCIRRFMIAAEHQGKGYAKEALQAALDYLRTKPCGDGAYCWLSYEPENTAARTLYHRFGFEENGEQSGDEIVAVRKL